MAVSFENHHVRLLNRNRDLHNFACSARVWEEPHPRLRDGGQHPRAFLWKKKKRKKL